MLIINYSYVCIKAVVISSIKTASFENILFVFPLIYIVLPIICQNHSYFHNMSGIGRIEKVYFSGMQNCQTKWWSKLVCRVKQNWLWTSPAPPTSWGNLNMWQPPQQSSSTSKMIIVTTRVTVRGKEISAQGVSAAIVFVITTTIVLSAQDHVLQNVLF